MAEEVPHRVTRLMKSGSIISVATRPQNYFSPTGDVRTSRLIPGHSARRCGNLNALECFKARKVRHAAFPDLDAGESVSP